MTTRRSTKRTTTRSTAPTPKKRTKTSSRGGKLESAPEPNRAARRAKPKHAATAMLPVRISGDLLNRIDAIKPEHLPREPFIRYVLDIGIKTFEEEEDE